MQLPQTKEQLPTTDQAWSELVAASQRWKLAAFAVLESLGADALRRELVKAHVLTEPIECDSPASSRSLRDDLA